MNRCAKRYVNQYVNRYDIRYGNRYVNCCVYRYVYGYVYGYVNRYYCGCRCLFLLLLPVARRRKAKARTQRTHSIPCPPAVAVGTERTSWVHSGCAIQQKITSCCTNNCAPWQQYSTSSKSAISCKQRSILAAVYSPKPRRGYSIYSILPL